MTRPAIVDYQFPTDEGTPSTQEEKCQFLARLTPRQFENLIERLYDAMGYETQLTPPQKDGGRDVIARRRSPGTQEELRIECKHYYGPVSVPYVRALLGVVSSEKANKGVLVCSSRFTRPAVLFAKANPRIELIDGPNVVMLMNEHLGANWASHIDRLIVESERAKPDLKSAPLA